MTDTRRKTSQTKRATVWFASLLWLPFVLACATGSWGPSAPQDPSQYRGTFSRTEFDVPVVLNEYTAAWIQFYQTRGRKHFKRHLERSYRYIPMMQAILEEHGLPKDAVYIALIESGFNAKAYSRARAVGFWQFISATGRRYGLRSNRFVEERRDFEKATHAAARYLKDLHGMFDDWYLAFAGYNAGEGKIMKAIKKYGTRDFWQLRHKPYLKRETKEYIPKYLAAMIIAKHPERFGFNDLEPHTPFEYETVDISGNPVHLKVAARLIARDQKELEDLNPELRLPMTPNGRRHYALRVPAETAEGFRRKFADLPPHRRMADQEHTVAAGETLQSLAKRHKMAVEYLAMANGLSKKAALRPGQRLGIPYRPPRKLWHYQDPSRVRYHRVREGESLWLIARKYNVSLKQLRAWNKGKIGRYLKPGQKIALRGKAASKSRRNTVAQSGSRPSKTTQYRVKSGDSLWSIARAHGIRVKQLKAWNHGKIGKHLKPGQRLTIKGSTRSAPSTQVAKAPPAKPTTGNNSSYTIQSGDSLWSIARRHKMTVAELKSLNQGKLSRYLKPGQRITIVRMAGSSAPRTTSAKPAAPPSVAIATGPEARQAIYHTIASGDTLWDIARKYGVKTREIKEWNGIEQVKRLRPGDKLKIYVKKSAPQEA